MNNVSPKDVSSRWLLKSEAGVFRKVQLDSLVFIMLFLEQIYFCLKVSEQSRQLEGNLWIVDTLNVNSALWGRQEEARGGGDERCGRRLNAETARRPIGQAYRKWWETLRFAVGLKCSCRTTVSSEWHPLFLYSVLLPYTFLSSFFKHR